MHANSNRVASLVQLCEDGPLLEKPWSERWAILIRPSSEAGEHEKSDSETPKPGMIGIVVVEKEAEIGYRIHPDWWGKG